ncbi:MULTISPECIES: branched-chain amino acid ABC transporter permease [Acinetobacter]|jgi:branched-chain amino acid transport system permease protein|uniref:branched-chain amino acid ABC transporter permease n=1 Tax=Acinetobacter TaxID=469 RepID=UPI0018DECBB1|nr:MULTISPECIES: branched-chain amino acid ABC transporter permease [Acinetobacter]MBJ9421996.1 branched-chain amino acid ABC transporter permease [Acinetobacter oleivorans]MDS7933167.1 branched-chain amino acid ABC transporter permease [Acinetobacter sp. V91_4B]MDS7963392.1 branched-chain amino acid ABC transporter permease [Acinetobacter sp. V91_7]MDS8027421.1 branched-chain amino acid ABC transporter permease [Acinetobacter sp. V91_13]
MSFFLEVLLGGTLAGVMYSLVAIGFVLIYRASGVFNFAQGSLVLFSALTFVNLTERGIPFVVAFIVTLFVIFVLVLLIDALILKHLINRSVITLFMATLGLSYVIEGLAQTVWGTQVHGLDLGISDAPINFFGIMLSKFDLFATGIAGTLVIILSLLFSKTRFGISLRAVADDPLAAQSVGIRLNHIWILVWTVAGFVALVAGLLWGARLGVQFSLSLVVLKALPVLIIGGFTSIAGAILAGLIVGATEKLAEIYLGGIIGSGIENWFPYVLAILFLLVYPTGLFGQKQVTRV